jgi:hypothetical protein
MDIYSSLIKPVSRETTHRWTSQAAVRPETCGRDELTASGFYQLAIKAVA